VAVRQSDKGLDVAKEKHEVIPFCPLDLSKVYSQEGLKSRSFHVAELSSLCKIHVHLRTYVDFWGGYSEHGRNVLFGLNNSGEVCVKLSPIRSLIDIDPTVLQRCNFLINNPAFDIKDSIYLTIAGPGWAQEQFIPKDRYSIIWTMIESLDCNPDITKWVSNVKELWVPTSVDEKRFIHDNKKIMRLGYNNDQFGPFVQPVDIPSLRGRYVFGVLGSWNKRKGIRKIIRAFCKEFKSTDNVSLLLVCKYGTRPYDGIKDGENITKEDKEKWSIDYEFKKYTEGLGDLPHVTLIDIPLHENIMPNIMARFDSLVGFSMGESSWLPGLQAMAMHKPVIQLESNCSGFMDYMGDTNSYLCRNSDIVLADDELVKGTSEYYEGQKFADGNEDELAETMREVYSDRFSQDQKNKVEEAAAVVSNEWTWKQSIENIIERLKEIKSGS
jgi:glycosyltransferase involved in cell wall biosynthesis